jgi:oxalyl-CoA decarboxylase
MDNARADAARCSTHGRRRALNDRAREINGRELMMGMLESDLRSRAETAPETLTDGFHLLIDALKLNGIETIYNVPGIPITDLGRYAQAQGLRVISFRHEQHAGYAAAAAGFLTKKPGICMTVSAPGFLNGLTALAHATTNCWPMILISGSSEREIVDLQQGDYEEMDQLAIARPHAKAAYRILHAQDIGVGVARAIRSALTGRPGGVYLDVPGALLGQVMDAVEGQKSLIKVVDPAPAHYPGPDAVARAVEALKAAKKPLIILGKGAAYAQCDDKVRQLVETLGFPYLPMSMAKGLLPDTHPLCASAARSMVLKDADCVFLIGARLNWLLSHGKGKSWGEPGSKTFVQIDIEPKEMDSNQKIDAPLVGDIESCVTALLEAMGPNWEKPSEEWTGGIRKKVEGNVAKMAAQLRNNNIPMDYHAALGVLKQVIADHPDTMLVNEGANALDLTRSIVDIYKPRKRLDVGTWGIMGIGMGSAVAAAIETGAQVLAVEGDSAFGFCGMEVETVCRYNLPVCIVIMNNNGIYRGDGENWGGGSDPSTTVFVKDARYDMMMEAFGGKGVTVRTPDELGRAVAEAFASRAPTLINALIDPAAGKESGNIGNLNPQSVVAKARYPQAKKI